MKKLFILSAALAAALHAGEDLGTINVESTTIDDRFSGKAAQVSSSAVISGEEVDRSHAENIHQLLNKVPGLTTEYTGGDSLKIHIRGVENQVYMGEKPGVAVVIDGVPVFERTGKVNIDLDNIESIRVVKGGASYLFGDDALAGAVIITTKRGGNDRPYTALEAGSFNYKKEVVRAGHTGEDYGFHVQYSQRTSDGYWEKSDYDTRYLNGKLQYFVDDYSDITVGVEKSWRQKDSHGTVGGVTEAEENPKSEFRGDPESRDYARMFDVELLKFFVTYSREMNDGANLLVNLYQYGDDTGFVSGPQTKDADGNTLTVYEDDAYVSYNDYSQIQRGLKSEYRKATDSWAWMAGLDLRANEYENKVRYLIDQAIISYAGGRPQVVGSYSAGTLRSEDQTDESVKALYGEVKTRLSEKMTATVNARYDSISLDYTDITGGFDLDKGFSVFSNRVGLTYALAPEATLYTSRSTGFRTPTISQLFAGKISTWGETVNNPDLEPEEAVNYDLGVRGTLPVYGVKSSYDATLFLLERKDYIMESTGQYSSAENYDPTLVSQYQNIGGVENKGLELSAQTDGSLPLSLGVAYTYLDATFSKYDNFYLPLGSSRNATVVHYDLTGKRVPRVPRHTFSLTADYRVLPSTLLTAEFRRESAYFADEMNKIMIDGHATVDLMVRYDREVAGHDLGLFLRVDNAFEEEYYNTARSSSDRNEDGVFDEEDLSISVNQGRTVTAGLSLLF